MAPAPASLQKAKLKIEGGDEITCWLNPKDLTVKRTNTFSADKATAQAPPPPQFTNAAPMTLALELLFDEAIAPPGQKVVDVCKKLLKAMEPTLDKPAPAQGGGTGAGGAAAGGTTRNTKRPPTMTFTWGGLLEPFTGNCKDLTIKYLLIKSTGEPRRAQANINLEQASPSTASGQKQNPTTRASEVGLGSHMVKDGDSLPSLAYSYYGSATEWRPIAEANGIDDPIRLRSGRSLFIPRIEL